MGRQVDRAEALGAAGGSAYAADDAPRIDPRSPQRFINRELSWLAFNERVLEEAGNPRHPLLERVRFLSISASNLNEFFMVRVAGLKGQRRVGLEAPGDDGLTPAQQIEAVIERAGALMANQQRHWHVLRDKLREEGIVVAELDELAPDDRAWAGEFFNAQLFPVLTPIAIDPLHPFPFIPNLGYSMALRLYRKSDGGILTGLVPLPSHVPRFIRMPGNGCRFMLREHIIHIHLGELFPGFDVTSVGYFRVLRDSDIEIEEEAEDLVHMFSSALQRRRHGSVIRVTIDADMPGELRNFVLQKLGGQPDDLLEIDGLIGLADTRELIVAERPDLQFAPFEPRVPKPFRDAGNDVFAAVRQGDILAHHPYESFDIVVRFVQEAARDPAVVAIKQTLYRTSDSSPVVAALCEAANAGKSVTALVEIKARFDEERNMRWAQDMERAGIHVIYGFAEFKTHAKVTLVVRRENKDLRSYVHFGTGNYHPITARVYTDLSLFTCDPEFGRDAAHLFNYMTGYASPERLAKLAVSPLDMRRTLIELLEEEVAHARAGRKGAVWAKLNSLVDAEIIDALYRASREGVEIDLVVRGICCLRPGIPGLSERIRVKSIVGRFLEHSRIVCVGAGGGLPSDSAKVFISSADWMPRNFDRRIEILVPVESPAARAEVLERILPANLDDVRQSWILGPDGSYHRVPCPADGFSAHEFFLGGRIP
ncbi:MAG TPA: RNA degradosome polyphosphate kinase [Alphaproteobacteria bacterium]